MLSKEAEKKIKNSVSNNLKNDLKKYGRKGNLTFEDVVRKIETQCNKCYVCEQEFKYDGKQWCHFFPSIDRFNNSFPHDCHNVAVACYFCNVRMFNGFCQKKCGLCEKEDHCFEGEIITKSRLYKELDHSNDRMRNRICCLTTN